MKAEYLHLEPNNNAIATVVYSLIWENLHILFERLQLSKKEYAFLGFW